MDEGEILIDSIEPISMQNITHDLAVESGFQSRADLLGELGSSISCSCTGSQSCSR